MSRRSNFVKEDGTHFRYDIYVSDLAIWLWMILFKAPHCHSYNVGSTQDLSVSEAAQSVRNVLLTEGEIRTVRVAVPGQYVNRYVLSVRRAEVELNVNSLTCLSNAIRKTGEWVIKGKENV